MQPRPALKITPPQDHNNKINPSQNHNAIWPTTEAAHDIVSIIKAFPNTFNTTGNMPRTYNTFIDPGIQPLQHARQKVPTEYRQQIKEHSQEMAGLQVIPPITQPTEWVPSFIYPCKPDDTLNICLDPHDLKKAIIHEH